MISFVLTSPLVTVNFSSSAGRNKTLKRGEVQETGKKIYKQKGMGVARRRHRTAAPHMRGGGKAHGQTLRDFDIDLPKKVRSLGLKIALSAKYQEGSLTVINSTGTFVRSLELFFSSG